MILALALTLLAHAGTPPCSSKEPSLKAFFDGYAEAYGAGDEEQLHQFFTDSFWEKFKDAVPKASGKHFDSLIKRAELRHGRCLVQWASMEKGAKGHRRDYSWFHLEEVDHSWKITSITSLGPAK